MQVSAAVSAITEAVEAEGLMLVHDQRLPSVTALIAGEPVMGSWWAHPLANVVYNALAAVDDRFPTCKLVAGKLTLVAPRLWPDIAAVGLSKEDWQLDELSRSSLALLDRVESESNPVLLDQAERRTAGRRLEERLLVAAEEVHTQGGQHVKALISWSVWIRDRRVNDPLPPPDAAIARFEAIVHEWNPTRRLLPWQSQ